MPERALLHAEATDLFAFSAEVEAEITEVLGRPRFVRAVTAARRARILDVLRGGAVWFALAERVTDCRDAKDNKYLESALAASAGTLVTGDADLLVLHPWRGIRIMRPAEYLADATGPVYSVKRARYPVA